MVSSLILTEISVLDVATVVDSIWRPMATHSYAYLMAVACRLPSYWMM